MYVFSYTRVFVSLSERVGVSVASGNVYVFVLMRNEGVIGQGVKQGGERRGEKEVKENERASKNEHTL